MVEVMLKCFPFKSFSINSPNFDVPFLGSCDCKSFVLVDRKTQHCTAVGLKGYFLSVGVQELTDQKSSIPKASSHQQTAVLAVNLNWFMEIFGCRVFKIRLTLN